MEGRGGGYRMLSREVCVEAEVDDGDDEEVTKRAQASRAATQQESRATSAVRGCMWGGWWYCSARRDAFKMRGGGRGCGHARLRRVASAAEAKRKQPAAKASGRRRGRLQVKHTRQRRRQRKDKGTKRAKSHRVKRVTCQRHTRVTCHTWV